jgi:hypothetical protein
MRLDGFRQASWDRALGNVIEFDGSDLRRTSKKRLPRGYADARREVHPAFGNAPERLA